MILKTVMCAINRTSKLCDVHFNTLTMIENHMINSELQSAFQHNSRTPQGRRLFDWYRLLLS